MGDSGVIGAVVVDHDAGPQLQGCVRSVLEDGADRVVVVENGAPGSVDGALADLLAGTPAPPSVWCALGATSASERA